MSSFGFNKDLGIERPLSLPSLIISVEHHFPVVLFFSVMVLLRDSLMTVTLCNPNSVAVATEI